MSEHTDLTYFAAKAMQGMLASGWNPRNMYRHYDGNHNRVDPDVAIAYRIAEAMVKQQEKYNDKKKSKT